MIPKKDAKGNVVIELSGPEKKKLQSAWPVLEQLGYHTRGGCSYNGVQGAAICQAASIVAGLVNEEARTEP